MNRTTTRGPYRRAMTLSLFARFALLPVLISIFSCAAPKSTVLTTESQTIKDRFDLSGSHFHGVLMKGTVYETPVFRFKGSETGLSVLIIGGTHGNEPAGFEAAYRLLERFSRISPKRGQVFIIPEANRVAVSLTDRRAPIPDGIDIERGNLNRCYPGDPQGFPMERVAHEIIELARHETVDLLLDLHESPRYHLAADSKDEEGQYHGLGQTLIYTPNDKAAWLGIVTLDELNREIPAGIKQFSLVERPIDRSAAWAAGSLLDIPGFTIETCKQLPLETRIEYQVRIVLRMTQEMGLLDEPSG